MLYIFLLLSFVSSSIVLSKGSKAVFQEDNSLEKLANKVIQDFNKPTHNFFIKNLQFLTIDHGPFVKDTRDFQDNKITVKMSFIRKPEDIIGPRRQMEDSLAYHFNEEYPDFFHVKKDIVFKKDSVTITLSDSSRSLQNDMIRIVEQGKL